MIKYGNANDEVIEDGKIKVRKPKKKSDGKKLAQDKQEVKEEIFDKSDRQS